MSDVVFLTYAYPPLRYPRSIQIYRLVKYSRHTIRVVSAEAEPDRDDSIDEHLPGRPALHTTVARPADRFGIRRFTDRMMVPDPQRSWARAAARRILRDGLISPGDTLVTFGNPMSSHLAGLEIKRAIGVPWIAHFSDPWFANPYRRLPPLAGPLDGRMERAVVAAADTLVFTTVETVDMAMSRYPAEWRAKAIVLPHAFDAELFGATPSRDSGDALVGRHVGSLYDHRTPDPFMTALDRLAVEDPGVVCNVSIEFIGHVAAGIDTQAEQRNGPSCPVRFADSVDYRQALRLMRESDFLLVIDAPFENSVFLPSKLIEYVGAERPILAISPPGAAATLVERLGGFVANPNDHEAVVAQLRATLVRARERRADFGDPAVREALSAPTVVARFDKIVDQVSRR